jgi:tetraacyldisaccharide 4'-kinase
MISEAPPFWWGRADWRAWALSPASALYGVVARERMKRAAREKVAAPVLCVGNLTVGGTGKTPVAMAIARHAARMRLKPGFLSRGHGGAVYHPHLVDLHHDVAKFVGDEPMLLARTAPTVVTPDRVAGARHLIEHGCNFIIMDDGFQSARIFFDYALLVVDAERGIGNGHTIPGGPMRARLVDPLRYVDAVLKVGEGDAADDVVRYAARAGRAVYQAARRTLKPARFRGRRFYAFTGIGNPSKFYTTLEAAGGTIVARRSFGDHHHFTSDDIRDLEAAARECGAELVTTTKDAARFQNASPAMQTFADALEVLEIEIAFEVAVTPGSIIEETLASWHRRRLEA